MLSIVIPALNAESALAATLASVFAPAVPDLDVLVVDGGSTDATRTIANDAGARIVDSPPGRGRQLALGAAAAKAEWLLFVHADTRLPEHWPALVSRFIVDEQNRQRAGYFRLAFDDSGAGARRVAALANWRAKAWGLPYGDQALLIHRTLYDALGGYRADLPLMEDVDLARRIGPMRLERLPGTVITSAIKYRRGGWWARPLRNLICLGLFLAGAPLRLIQRFYA